MSGFEMVTRMAQKTCDGLQVFLENRKQTCTWIAVHVKRRDGHFIVF